MCKSNLVIILFPLIFISACSNSDTSTYNSASQEELDTTVIDLSSDESDEITVIDFSSSELECVNGRYSFTTDSDGEVHFDASFDGDGGVYYYLSEGPTGTYTVDGSTVSFTGPFGENLSTATFNWTITSSNSDCLATEIKGSSRAGTKMTAYLR